VLGELGDDQVVGVLDPLLDFVVGDHPVEDDRIPVAFVQVNVYQRPLTRVDGLGNYEGHNKFVIAGEPDGRPTIAAGAWRADTTLAANQPA
jgi:hypothetical protein